MKNIIITGGELFNKGAQAMTFIAVDEMKKRFPDHNIYVFSERDCKRPKEEQEQYAFYFTGWYPYKFAKAHNNPLLRTVCLIRNGKDFRKCEELYRNTDIMLDISGYALGSIWSDNCNKLYLDNLRFAKEFQIPIYLMPQSFGPFMFEEEGRHEIDLQIRDLLPHCKVICAREKEGYDELTNKLGLKNVILKPDLVLNNQSVDYSNVYKIVPKLSLPIIKKRSVAIIPNSHNASLKSKNVMLEIYQKVIQYLIDEKYEVCLIYHAVEDQKICKELKDCFCRDERVQLMDQEFSCREFSEMVKNFDFLIASRYHSIVHAYKKTVPCVVLGWATKYYELVSMFEQEQYFFDMREKLSEERLISSVQRLAEVHKRESLRIERLLKDIQRENVFNIIKG
ncbi:MAG: polysaccharide pyruvyl transferase family protein [Dorea sp.]|nr:polysaccharide pyruvyl transferase family protein [Dorea sp.]